MALVLVLVLVLPLLAWAFYALGSLRARRELERELRAARQELRLRAEVAAHWGWRSDGLHHLLHWQTPAHATDGGSPAATPELAVLNNALLPLLQAGRSFVAVTLFADGLASASPAQAQTATRRAEAVAQRPGCHWQVTGSPCVDDEGQFSGFIGSAQLLDPERFFQGTSAGLTTLLAASGHAVLAWDEGNGCGFVLQHLSPDAKTAWPGAAVGQPLLSAAKGPAGRLAIGLAQAVAELAHQDAGSSVDLAEWRLVRFDAGLGRPGLWMGRIGSSGGISSANGAIGNGAASAPAAQAGNSEAEQFSMTVSHDLRAPIRVVEGFTRIVKEDYGHLLDRVGNDHLDRVLGAAARMNLMIDALLTLARLSTQPLARQPVNLSQLGLYVVDDLRRGAPEREADIEIEPGLTAHGDPTLLRLVLENLLGNAWKYTSRCSRARIVLRQVDKGPLRVFEVLDNGAGFDMRSADRLFGLFQRLHSANDFPGHGVGLASVRRIVQRHGGEIWAEAEPGRGASFQFTLAN